MIEVFLVATGGLIGIVGTIIGNMMLFHSENKKRIKAQKEDAYISALNTFSMITIFSKRKTREQIDDQMQNSFAKMALFSSKTVEETYCNLVNDLYQHLYDEKYYVSKSEEYESLVEKMKAELKKGKE